MPSYWMDDGISPKAVVSDHYLMTLKIRRQADLHLVPKWRRRK